MAEQSYVKPTTVDEALAQLRAGNGESLLLAGGTDVQTYRKQGLERCAHLIDLTGIASLRQITAKPDRLEIGAMTTLDHLARSKEAEAWCPMISAAARAIASPTIRYTATVGGNLMVSNRCTFYNQSKLWRESAGSCLRETGPTCLATGGTDKCYARNVSDFAPALIVLNGRVEIRDTKGVRTLPLSDLYVPDGMRGHDGLGTGTIVTAVHVSLKPAKWYYRKLRQRESIDFSSLTVAGALDSTGLAHICINGISMSPVVIETQLASTNLIDLQLLTRRTCKTVDNDILPLKYRRQMIDVFLEELWQSFSAK
jgi:4-hydroxybenzoyl-CoA reductase beta subunit